MLISTLEEARTHVRDPQYGVDLDVEVHYSEDTGDIEVFQFKVRCGRSERSPLRRFLWKSPSA
jgi:hypothetical protein